MKKPSGYIEDVSNELLTAEELLRLDILGKRTELVRGRLIVREPAGFQHGVVAARIGRRLGEFVDARGLGVVVAAETGFKLATDPDTVRAPDAGYVAKAHLPDPLPKGFADFALDLAVEVLSPGDRAGDVLAKLSDWLTSGVRLVWVIDPARQVVRVYRADGSEFVLGAADSLDGEDVLPGFRCPIADLL